MNQQELINQFYENMAVSKRAMRGSVQAFIGSFQISPSQLELLFILKQSQPTNAKQLASSMQLTQGAISQLVDDLVAKGWVGRNYDESDRRKQVVYLSEDGSSRLQDIEKRRAKLMKNVLAELSVDELQALIKVQKKITDTLTALHCQDTNTK